MMYEWIDKIGPELIVVLYLLVMTVYGHYRGFFKIALSMAALILTLIISHIATPYVFSYLNENSDIRERIKVEVVKQLNLEGLGEGDYDVQQELIRDMDIPSQIKSILAEENTKEVWKVLGVERFGDYLGSYISGIFFQIICFIAVFLTVRLLLQFLLIFLEVFAKLPFIHGMNQIAGAIVGFFQGLIYIWIAFIAIFIFASAGMNWGMQLHKIISESIFVSFLYRYNPLSYILKNIFYFMIK